MSKAGPSNTLYYADNLSILRGYVDDELVDLIYLDPPFNSNADYNVLFAESDGTEPAAIEANQLRLTGTRGITSRPGNLKSRRSRKNGSGIW